MVMSPKNCLLCIILGSEGNEEERECSAPSLFRVDESSFGNWRSSLSSLDFILPQVVRSY